MKHEHWDRQKYRQLEEMVKKNAMPGEMATKFKIDKKNLEYRLKVLRTQTDIRTWDPRELELLSNTKNLDSYIVGYLNIYGKYRDRNIAIAHWTDREKYLLAYEKEKEKLKVVHTIEIKQKQITEPIKPGNNIPVVGEDDTVSLLVKLNNKIAELVQVQKDTYVLFKILEERGRKAK